MCPRVDEFPDTLGYTMPVERRQARSTTSHAWVVPTPRQGSTWMERMYQDQQVAL